VTVGNYCYQSIDAAVPGVKSLWHTNNTFYVSWPISVFQQTSERPAPSTLGRLTTDLFHLNVLLDSAAGPYSYDFASGQPVCQPGAVSLGNCGGEPQSWYAVLLSPSDTVLDTYPSYSGSTQWTIANVSFGVDDQLVLVSPDPVFTLHLSGLQLDSNGMAPYVCCGINFGPQTESGGTFTL
jgi:hypothetical protein